MKRQAISLRPVAESGVAARAMGLALGRKSGKVEVNEKRLFSAGEKSSQTAATVEESLAAKDNGTVLPDLGMAAMLLHRIRYFTDGAVIGTLQINVFHISKYLPMQTDE